MTKRNITIVGTVLVGLLLLVYVQIESSRTIVLNLIAFVLAAVAVVLLLKDPLTRALIIALGFILFAAMRINLQPNPDRTVEELTPCREVLVIIDAEGELECLTATIDDFRAVFTKHTDEWSQSDGTMTYWTEEQIKFLFPTGNVNQPDINSFRWVRSFYQQERGKFLTETKWVLNPSILVVGIALTIFGGIVAMIMGLTKLAPIASFGFPAVVIIMFLLGLGGMYFPVLGIMPTNIQVADDVSDLFWFGFGINAGSAVLGIIIQTVGKLGAETKAGGFITLVLSALIAIPLVATFGIYAVNETVAGNAWLSNSLGTNSLYMGFLFASGVVGALMGFIPKGSED